LTAFNPEYRAVIAVSRGEVARNLLADSGNQIINRAPDARAFAHVRAEMSTQRELSAFNNLRRHLVHGLD
jgi:hypothetical protein